MFKALLILGVLFPSLLSSQTLWNGTSWGMSVSDVHSLVPEAVPPVKPSDITSGAVEKLQVPEILFSGNPYTVKFFFIDDKLDQVTLESRKGESFQELAPVCNSAMAAMAYIGDIQDFEYVTPDVDENISVRQRFGLADKLSNVDTEIINFGLGPDHALGVWDQNNLFFKPQWWTLTNKYRYLPDEEPGFKAQFFWSGSSDDILSRVVASQPEAMGYVTASCSHAAGAKSEIGKKVTGFVDMGENGFGFGTEHSAEWVFPIQKTYPFWSEILIKFDIKSN